MEGFVFTRLVNGKIQTAERNERIRGTEARDITDFTKNQACCDISDTGDREDIRAYFVDVTLDLRVICGNSFFNML